MPRGSRTLANSRKPAAPPYNPGDGVDPPFMVGRRDVLESIEEALTTGPRSQWFGHGLVGDRAVPTLPDQWLRGQFEHER